MEDEKEKVVEMTDEEFEDKLEELERKLMELKKEVKSLVDFIDKKDYIGGGYITEIVALLERSIFKINNLRTDMDYWNTKEDAIEITEEMNQFSKKMLEQMKEDVRKMREGAGFGKDDKN